jgi:hybrid cluster-associated redox disulfide protein
MNNRLFSPDTIVADVLKVWPQTIPVFLRHKTACVGCVMSPFETLVDVSKNYQIPMNDLLAELANSVSSDNM